MVELATRAMLGERVRNMGYGTGLYKAPDYFAVKVPVFSFEKLMDVDTHLGPEMKSTGEVLGIAATREEALFKGMVAAGWKMIHPETCANPGILFSVRKSDLPELPQLARKFHDLGFKLYATTGNAETIERSGMTVTHVAKVHENYHENVMTLLESGTVDYVVSTSAKGRDPATESVKLRRLAVEHDIDCLTAIDTANALADCLASPYALENVSVVDMNELSFH
jgi:carbamoyl-phosphate synthase large subunit